MIPELDFHLIPHSETRKRLIEFLSVCYNSGIPCCRIIHGKGISSKKLQIYHYLEEIPYVYGYDDDGSNWGATIVEFTE